MSPSSFLAPTCPYAQSQPELLNHSSSEHPGLVWKKCKDVGGGGFEQILADSVSITQHFLHLIKPGRERRSHKDLGMGAFKVMAHLLAGPRPPQKKNELFE